MLNDIKKDAQARMTKSIEALRHTLIKVRTGRASTALVEHLKVNYYGSDVPLSQVATVAVSDARSLTITPWEKQIVGAVEKAILASDRLSSQKTQSSQYSISSGKVRHSSRRVSIEWMGTVFPATRF